MKHFFVTTNCKSGYYFIIFHVSIQIPTIYSFIIIPPSCNYFHNTEYIYIIFCCILLQIPFMCIYICACCSLLVLIFFCCILFLFLLSQENTVVINILVVCAFENRFDIKEKEEEKSRAEKEKNVYASEPERKRRQRRGQKFFMFVMLLLLSFRIIFYIL